MGATDSKENLHEHLNEESTPQTTPEKNSGVLKLCDPRSPTDGIERTPIVSSTQNVEFNDPRSPTVEIARTPCPESMTDPRSPTEGIARTPAPANPFFFPDPRSPTVSVARTPLSKTDPKMEPLAEETSSDKTKLIEGEASRELEHSDKTEKFPEHPTKETQESRQENDNGLIAINTPEFEMEMAKISLDESNPNEVLDESLSATLILSDKGNSRRSQSAYVKRSLKEKFQTSITSQSRSPLSTRNVVHDSLSSESTSTQKRSTRSNRPTRLVGRYEPVMDKENM